MLLELSQTLSNAASTDVSTQGNVGMEFVMVTWPCVNISLDLRLYFLLKSDKKNFYIDEEYFIYTILMYITLAACGRPQGYTQSLLMIYGIVIINPGTASS